MHKTINFVSAATFNPLCILQTLSVALGSSVINMKLILGKHKLLFLSRLKNGNNQHR